MPFLRGIGVDVEKVRRICAFLRIPFDDRRILPSVHEHHSRGRARPRHVVISELLDAHPVVKLRSVHVDLAVIHIVVDVFPVQPHVRQPVVESIEALRFAEIGALQEKYHHLAGMLREIPQHIQHILFKRSAEKRMRGIPHTVVVCILHMQHPRPLHEQCVRRNRLGDRHTVLKAGAHRIHRLE